MTQFIAFMAHLPEDQFDYLEDKLKERCSTALYVIAHETEPYSHFHFLVQMSNEDWVKFRKTIFIDHYKLAGQARNGKPRQYGKVKEIKDLDKMLSYTIKDNSFRTNMAEEQIADALDKSFKQERQLLLKDRMILFIEEKMKEQIFDHREDIEIMIIEYCIANKIHVRRTVIDCYYSYFRQFTHIEELRYNARKLHKLIMLGNHIL